VDRALMRALLWGALAVVLLALAFPYVAPRLLTF
jgi:mercuric ion transport protein